MNVQVFTEPGAAASRHGIIDALAAAGLKCWVDKAYQDADRLVRVPFRGRRLKRGKRRHNCSHAKIRCVGEQAMAILKGWRLLRRLRCSMNRITDIVKAVVVLMGQQPDRTQGVTGRHGLEGDGHW